jgi:hypothetical protein
MGAQYDSRFLGAALRQQQLSQMAHGSLFIGDQLGQVP